ncbi:putative hydrolase of the HAD superfamily [Amphibacillus marinus]|uniref:Putative hydrolase of the HAD superfamily n=1 Tax=Amphibacillus marinus TaxID=872970 RepID=A0A1H8T8J2_9BACI|nr:HAD family hydrolase [Amphibacillus marinus]SEO87222.1 putative hydrolase of the HAD superfamily [Amphibacillus marinus]
MKTIIFDVDDTLYDQALSFHKTFKSLIDPTYSYTDIDTIYRTSRQYSEILFDQSEAGEISVLEWQVGRISKALADYDIQINDEQALAFHAQYKDAQANISLFPEVKELLNHLAQQDIQLAILTNGEESHQLMKINQLKLTNWIPMENIFVSGTYGIAKPKAGIFKIVEDKLQCEPGQTVYVGDSFEKDIVGAKQVGWHVLWMNHRKHEQPSNSSIKPDKVVDSAAELLRYFKETSFRRV